MTGLKDQSNNNGMGLTMICLPYKLCRCLLGTSISPFVLKFGFMHTTVSYLFGPIEPLQ